MKKITSEQIKKALENYSGEVERLKSGTARNATLDGSICAAGFGSSLLGQAKQRNLYLENKKQKQEIKNLKKEIGFKKRVRAWTPATEKQISYLKILGFEIQGKISKLEASNEIKKILRETEKLNREIQKRIDLDV